MLESLLNKVACLKAKKRLKKRLQHKCFPVKIAKLFRTTFYKAPPVATSIMRYTDLRYTDIKGTVHNFTQILFQQ